MNNQQPPTQPNIKFTFQPSADKVNYTNFVFINNSSEEFLLDFGTITPGKEGIEVFERIAMSPRNAKLVAGALVERIKQYEEQFGEIKMPVEGVTK